MFMKVVNIHEAKTHLSKLLVKVAAGEEIIIAKAGKPVARLISTDSMSNKPILGSERGKVFISDDFNDPLPEFEKLIYGEDTP